MNLADFEWKTFKSFVTFYWADSLLQMMELVDECMEQLHNIKLDVQIKIDANKPSAPAPLPPPPPPSTSLIQPGKISIKFKSIDGLTISSGRNFLEHVSFKNRPKTSFDVEVSAAMKYDHFYFFFECQIWMKWIISSGDAEIKWIKVVVQHHTGILYMLHQLKDGRLNWKSNWNKIIGKYSLIWLILFALWPKPNFVWIYFIKIVSDFFIKFFFNHSSV